MLHAVLMIHSGSIGWQTLIVLLLSQIHTDIDIASSSFSPCKTLLMLKELNGFIRMH